MSTPFPTDPLQAVTHADPYPYYAALARDRPLYRDARLGLWVASAPGTIRDIMRHPAARVRPMAEPVPRGIAAGPAGLLFGRFLRMNDGPRQARLKALFRAFLARQAPLAPAPDWPRLEMDTGSAGAIDRYLHAAPVFAQACALGLPGAVAADCAREVGAFLAALPPAAPEDRVAAGHTAAERLLARLGAHLDDRAASPALRELRGQGADAGLEPALLAANLAGLLFQSCEAGAGLLGNALLRAGRQRAGAALTLAQAWELVDATLRHDPPFTTPAASWPAPSNWKASSCRPARPCCWCWPRRPWRSPRRTGPSAPRAMHAPGATRRAAMRPARWSICCGPASTTPPWWRAFATAPAQCPHSPI
ncbi:cytochrome [Achromobacter xylosoxidans]